MIIDQALRFEFTCFQRRYDKITCENPKEFFILTFVDTCICSYCVDLFLTVKMQMDSKSVL